MAKNERQKQFILKWYERAFETNDEFDAFFCFWVSLVVAAQIYSSSNFDNETDREKVKKYFRVNKDEILSLLYEHKDNMVRFALRRGAQNNTPMLDASGHLKDKFTQLSAYFLGTQQLSDDLVVSYTAELFNKVRNNVFHGGKMYDEQSDIEILEIVNPILDSILQKCEKVTVDQS
ncbi:MAG: hypothetical protein JNM09_20875 [Blastocatellia bacterium]|nr:hypothetical protein [Blastocatellia bacterium]